MAHTADETTADALPDPEMNPLQNPLLAANMGRWAEVYFTNPPERRAEAVAELVRELQKTPRASEENEDIPNHRVDAEPESESREASKAVPVRNETHFFRSEPIATEGRAIEAGGTEFEQLDAAAGGVPVSCRICGHENSQAQRFCGMCGMQLDPLQPAEQVEPQQMPRSEPELREASSAYEARTPSFLGLGQRENDQHENDGIRFETRREEAERIWSRPEPSLPSFAVDAEEVPHRYRVYIAIAVAMLLSALLVMAWRGTKAWSGHSDVTTLPAAQPAPGTEDPGHSEAVPAPTANSATPANPTPAPAATPAEKHLPVAKPAVEKHAVAKHAAPRQPAVKRHPIAPQKTILPQTAVDESGQQDYETAEKFLGAPGGRNSGEAATYLWRAVGKGNAAATITLSDMYLRGDGVAKNCDQARLLLDAAARKGLKGAAERLRNLQAFGCQ